MLSEQNDNAVLRQMQEVVARVNHDSRNHPHPPQPPISNEKLNFATGKVEPR